MTARAVEAVARRLGKVTAQKLRYDREQSTSTNGLVAPCRVRTQIRTAQPGSIPSLCLGIEAITPRGLAEFTDCRSDKHLAREVSLRSQAYRLDCDSTDGSDTTSESGACGRCCALRRYKKKTHGGSSGNCNDSPASARRASTASARCWCCTTCGPDASAAGTGRIG